MISVITYGRNDNYSFNLTKRVALGFNCLAEVLTEKDEILFVDYNTPEHLGGRTLFAATASRSLRLFGKPSRELAGAHSY